MEMTNGNNQAAQSHRPRSLLGFTASIQYRLVLPGDDVQQMIWAVSRHGNPERSLEVNGRTAANGTSLSLLLVSMGTSAFDGKNPNTDFTDCADLKSPNP
jgi:hypothetical protein